MENTPTVVQTTTVAPEGGGLSGGQITGIVIGVLIQREVGSPSILEGCDFSLHTALPAEMHHYKRQQSLLKVVV
ncbi:hypothetical protein Tcan_08133 [Toxocara canis]|uniref:Uncharacterized protein n=1 Tax=Toxocara canis TaxID=6265 RepID=A0A0B2VW45_TOXCA|nr:hypothetical protein Tcan_08133 [Toxocara canis]